jgi:mannan endo-1,4-beta-mannosidase
MGIDHYYHSDATALVRAVRIAVSVAAQRDKVAALTEFGVRDGLKDDTPHDWFSRNFFYPLVNDPVASRIVYALAWRNANQEHFFAPHPAHHTATDFVDVCADERLLLQRDLPLPE